MRCSRWCILRTSGGQTLPLVRSLRDAGYEAWSPARTIRRVLFPGKKAEKRIEIDVPILPTFVFVQERHVDALALITRLPISPYPAFSVFHHGGRVPLIGDGQIAGLRAEEEREAATMQAMRDAETYQAAEEIRIAAIKSEAARRRATRELELGRRAELRSKNRKLGPGTEIEVAEMPALAGMTGVVEANDGKTAHVRFGSHSWKIDAWRLSPGNSNALAA